MNTPKSMFLKKWVAGNLVVYPVFLGLLHPMIAHGFTGDHDKLLTTPQFIMHTVSIFIFLFFLALSKNKTFEAIGIKKTLSNAWPFLFFAPWVFWLGYYTLFVPFDILFMFLSIGIITALQIKPFVKSPSKWIWQCMLGYFLAAVAGISIGLSAHVQYYKNFHGISKDLATWLSISVPAAFVVAYYFRYVLGKQIRFEECHDMAESKANFSKVA